MRTNIDHDVFIKKMQSDALATDVADFLSSHGLNEPVQIPFGTKSKASYSFVRDIAPKAEKLVFNGTPVNKKIDEHNRIDFNREARSKAYIANQKTFEGICRKPEHGKCTHIVRSNGNDHMCKHCSDSWTRMQTEKRRLAKLEGK